MATKWSMLIAVVLIAAGPASAIYHGRANQDYMQKTLYANNHNNMYYPTLNPSASSGANQQGVPLPYASGQGSVSIQPGTHYTATTYGQSANVVQPNIAPPVAPSPAKVTVEFADSPSASSNAAQTYATPQSYATASVAAPAADSVTVNAAVIPSASEAQQAAAVKSEPTVVTFTNSPAETSPASSYNPPPASYNVAPTAEQASAATRLQPLYTQVSSDPSQTLTINRPSEITPQSPSMYAQFNGNLNRPVTIDSVQQTTMYTQQIPVRISLNEPSTFLSPQSASVVQSPAQIQSYLPSQGHAISSYTRPVEAEVPPPPTNPQYRPPYGSASQNVYMYSSPGFAETFGPTLKQRPALEFYVSPSGAVYLTDQNGNMVQTQQYAPGYSSGFSVYAAPQPSHVGSMHPLTENDLKSNLKINPSAVPAQIDNSASYNFKANDMTGLYKPITYLGPVSNPLRYIATFNNNQQPIRLSISAGRTAEGEDRKNINVVPQMAQMTTNPQQTAQLTSNGQQTNSNNPQQKSQSSQDEEIRKLEEKISEKEAQRNGINAKISSLSGKTGTPQQKSDSELISGGTTLLANSNQMSGDDRSRAAGDADHVVGNPQAIIRGLQQLSKMGLGDLLVFSPPGYAESLALQDSRATAP